MPRDLFEVRATFTNGCDEKSELLEMAMSNEPMLHWEYAQPG
jgi:hypothetical protein